MMRRARQGPRGRQGLVGPAGSAGAAGPSGQASRATSTTPGATPGINDADVVLPPLAEDLPIGASLTIMVDATCERIAEKTARHLRFSLCVRTTNLGGVVLLDGFRSDPAVTSAGWAGLATITFAPYMTGGVLKIRAVASGPAAATGCNWLIVWAFEAQKPGSIA